VVYMPKGMCHGIGMCHATRHVPFKNTCHFGRSWQLQLYDRFAEELSWARALPRASSRRPFRRPRHEHMATRTRAHTESPVESRAERFPSDRLEIEGFFQIISAMRAELRKEMTQIALARRNGSVDVRPGFQKSSERIRSIRDLLNHPPVSDLRKFSFIEPWPRHL
jgi:hypothetical protein